MTLRRLLPATLALLMLPTLAGTAAADIPVPNSHSQSTEVILDFGVYADYTTRVHKVAKGDTLQAIAKAMLGKVSRWREIADLNPDVKPDKLKVDALILVPPAKKPLTAPAEAKPRGEVRVPQASKGPKVWWHVFSQPTMTLGLIPIAHGQKVPVDHYGATVFAVRHDKLAYFHQRLEDDKKEQRYSMRGWMKTPPAWFAVAKNLRIGRGSAHDSDPIWRIEKRMQITSMSGGVMHLKQLSVRYFNENGKELTAKQIQASKGRRYIVLILLALGGAAGLVFVLRRRRSQVPSAA